jgi:hypothetical protein
MSDPRLVGRNGDREDVYVDDAGRVVRVGGVDVVCWVRPVDVLSVRVPPWARWLAPNRATGQAADGRLLCGHCTAWRTVAALTSPENACPIGWTLRPGVLVSLNERP